MAPGCVLTKRIVVGGLRPARTDAAPTTLDTEPKRRPNRRQSAATEAVSIASGSARSPDIRTT